MFGVISIVLLCILPLLTAAESEDLLKLQLFTVNLVDTSEPGVETVSSANAATVCIGTPCQNFTVMLDSGSSDLWVSSTRCKSATCSKQRRFNEQRSRTYRNTTSTFSITYASGNLDGVFGLDSVTLAGITVRNQKFGQAVTSSEQFARAGLDGILGMAFKGLARSKSTPVFQTMVTQRIVQQPVFTFCKSPESADYEINELILGGTDKTRYPGKELVYTNVTGDTYWKFKFDSIDVDGDDSACPDGDGCDAAADTGTTLLRGPKGIIDAINTLVGAKFYQGTQYKIDCNLSKAKSVNFIISGTKFTLEPKDYVMRVSSSTCVTGFAVTQGKGVNFLVVGGTFLNGKCTQFDFGRRRIGFVDIDI